MCNWHITHTPHSQDNGARRRSNSAMQDSRRVSARPVHSCEAKGLRKRKSGWENLRAELL